MDKSVLENVNPIVHIFNNELRKSAKKKLFQKCSMDEKDKMLHRLLTCSFDIEKRNDIYCIYFSGLEEGKQLCYFELDWNTKEYILKEIERCRFGNIEKKDFFNRLIIYTSYSYINYDIATTYIREHNELMGYIEGVSTVSEYVRKYLSCAKRKFYDYDKKEYGILNDLVNSQMTEEVKKVIVRKLDDFFEYDKRQYLLGSQLEELYVKFSFPEDKKDEYVRIGDRQHYVYKEGGIAEDYFEGCGFSFGEICKAFYYFQYGVYGEQVMFVSPLKNDVYYRREYEYLGKKLKVIKIGNMGEIDVLDDILEKMSDAEKASFFSNQSSVYFNKSFGSVELTINKMREYDEAKKDNRYEKAIEYLMAQQRCFGHD